MHRLGMKKPNHKFFYVTCNFYTGNIQPLPDLYVLYLKVLKNGMNTLKKILVIKMDTGNHL